MHKYAISMQARPNIRINHIYQIIKKLQIDNDLVLVLHNNSFSVTTIKHSLRNNLLLNDELFGEFLTDYLPTEYILTNIRHFLSIRQQQQEACITRRKVVDEEVVGSRYQTSCNFTSFKLTSSILLEADRDQN